MKKTILAIAVASAAISGSAQAVPYSDTEVLSFAATASDMSFKLSWTDLLYKNTKPGAMFEKDGKYSITLTNDINKTIFSIGNSSLNDVAGKTFGYLTQTFNSLSVGQSYSLTFSGKWTGPDLPSGKLVATGTPTVSIAAVPEPETYAMFLAGLGIIGAIAKRRSRA